MFRSRTCVAALILAAGLPACSQGDDSAAAPAAAAPQSAPPDLEAIAASLVNQAAGVKPGENVAISGGIRDFELLENIVTNVSKAGGNPLLLINSERIARRYYDEVDARYDTLPPAFGLAAAEVADVMIAVEMSETPDLLAHVPPERLTAHNAVQNRVFERLRERGARFIEVGNDMYPTHARAARFGLTRDQLAGFFWGALQSSPDSIRANAAALEALLKTAREVHVTDPHGTDLRIRLGSNPVFISDGAVTEEDVQRGERFVYLPAGEVYTRPVHEGTNGVIVADRQPYEGKFIEDFRLRIENGRIVEMGARAGIEGFRAMHEAQGEGRDLMSALDFGVNPGLKATTSAQLRTWVPEGTVTIAFGNDIWVGGDNDMPYGLSVSIPDATVRIDGRVVVENGALKRP